MKIRVWGRREECADFVAYIRAALPAGCFRDASGFYPNRGSSTEGRVYVEFDAPATWPRPCTGKCANTGATRNPAPGAVKKSTAGATRNPTAGSGGGHGGTNNSDGWD